MKRKRYQDTHSLGRSEIAPYKPGESYRRRHARRKAVNLEAQERVEEWCQANGWQFRVTNDGHHWQLRKGHLLIEWWPSSAKLVRAKTWQKGVHCHDWKKLIEYLEKQ